VTLNDPTNGGHPKCPVPDEDVISHGGSCPPDLILGLTQPQVIGISATILAIIIVVPTVAIVLAIVGGKKGYDYYKLRAENMSAAASNPLYKDDGMTGTNPFFEQPKPPTDYSPTHTNA